MDSSSELSSPSLLAMARSRSQQHFPQVPPGARELVWAATSHLTVLAKFPRASPDAFCAGSERVAEFPVLSAETELPASRCSVLAGGQVSAAEASFLDPLTPATSRMGISSVEKAFAAPIGALSALNRYAPSTVRFRARFAGRTREDLQIS